MSEDRYTFEQARARLEEIVGQVRDRDTSLEASLDLLEESVRLANQCTELIDHTQWRTVLAEVEAVEALADPADPAGEPSESAQAEETTGEDPAEGSSDVVSDEPDQPDAPEAQAV